MFHTINRLLDADWSPLTHLRDLDQEFGKMLNAVGSRTQPYPPVNLREEEDQVEVTAELPGVDPEKIDVSVKDDVLTLAGEREALELDEQSSWVLRERFGGAFKRRIALPWPVENDGIKARYEHGVLRITLPRAESHKPRKIEIEQA